MVDELVDDGRWWSMNWSMTVDEGRWNGRWRSMRVDESRWAPWFLSFLHFFKNKSNKHDFAYKACFLLQIHDFIWKCLFFMFWFVNLCNTAQSYKLLHFVTDVTLPYPFHPCCYVFVTSHTNYTLLCMIFTFVCVLTVLHTCCCIFKHQPITATVLPLFCLMCVRVCVGTCSTCFTAACTWIV